MSFHFYLLAACIPSAAALLNCLTLIPQYIMMRRKFEVSRLHIFNLLLSSVFCFAAGIIIGDVETSPNFLRDYVLPLACIDFIMFPVHKYLLHGPLRKIHSVHHSRTLDKLWFLDLYYINTLDGLLEHYLPVSLTIALNGRSFATSSKFAFLLLFFNMFSHSGIDPLEHKNHHNHKDSSYGIGILLDVFYEREMILQRLITNWLFIYAYYITPLSVSIPSWIAVSIIYHLYTFYQLRIKQTKDEHSRDVRSSTFWLYFYTLLHKLHIGKQIGIMNWGYANALESHIFTPEQFRVNMYHKVTEGLKKCQALLEVGCGNSHGLNMISNLADKTYGIDLCEENIKYGKQHFQQLILNVDDAITLKTCSSEAFDVVVNVESSHCYPEIEKFYDNVYRVLKPGGTFCYTDFASTDFWVKFPHLVSKFKITHEEDITKNVMVSSSLIHSYYKVKFRPFSYIPGLRCIFESFSNSPSSETYKQFSSGEYKYMMFKLVKE